MKYCILILMTVFATENLQAQSFCGHIKYRFSYYKGKNMKDITSKVKDSKVYDYYTCNNKSKSYLDGKLQDIYIGDSLTYFLAVADSTLWYIKTNSAYNEDLPEYLNFKDSAVYNGKQYKSLEQHSKKSKLIYYYRDDIIADSSLYLNYKLYHQDLFYKNTKGGIYLVSINKSKQITLVSEAVEINKMNLTDQDFKLPDGYKIGPFTTFEIVNK